MLGGFTAGRLKRKKKRFDFFFFLSFVNQKPSTHELQHKTNVRNYNHKAHSFY